MNTLIVIGIIVGAPVLLILLTRTKASLVFMALCVGSVLATFAGDTAVEMIDLFVKGANQNTLTIARISLMLSPAVLTLLFLNRMVSGSKVVMNFLPAVFTGVLTLFLVVPILPGGVRNDVLTTDVWTEIVQYQSIIVSVACFLSLVQLWASGAGARAASKGSKSKKK